MRITIVMGFFLPVPALQGGATEKIWPHLARLLAEAGHEVTIVSRRWPGLADRESAGRLHHLRLPGIRHTRWLPLNLLLDFLWGLQVLVRAPRADVIVCNTVSLPVYARWLRPAAGRVAVVLGRMPKGQNRLYGATDLILATSTAVAAKARAENPRLGERIFTLPNSIDWLLHQAAGAARIPDQGLTIGYVGRIHPEKGLECLLEAAAELARQDDLPTWRLVLVGPVAVAQGGGGEAYRDGLRDRFGTTLGDRLEFLAPVYDAAALARIYGGLDVFCYPSTAAQGEGLSVAPIEAMAAGAVPVVSRLDCYHDLIVPDVNGLQFDQTSAHAPPELARLLASLLRDPQRRRRLAQAAQETARHHDFSAAIPPLLARFERLLAPAP